MHMNVDGNVKPQISAATHDRVHVVVGGANNFSTRPIWTMLDAVNKTLVE
jgi:hypothetical protein